MESAEQLQSRAERVAEALHARLGLNLHSCILYGSAVRGEAAKTSDINLLIVLAQATPEAHAAIADLLREHPRVEPFVHSLENLPRSQQAFALKFRSIQRHYRVLAGADVLANFSADARVVRFVCEQTIRNLRLRLTHQFIVNGRDARRYTRYVVESVAGLFAGLSEALRCEGIELPAKRSERIPILQKHFGEAALILTQLLELKKSAGVLRVDEIQQTHARLYGLLTAAVRWMEARWPTLLPDQQS